MSLESIVRRLVDKIFGKKKAAKSTYGILSGSCSFGVRDPKTGDFGSGGDDEN